MNVNEKHQPECTKCSGLCRYSCTAATNSNNTVDTIDAGKQSTCTCITCTLRDITTPLWGRFDQLLDTAYRMLDLLERREGAPIDLNEQLIDAFQLKLILKVGDTKFARMKKLFKAYEVDKKTYYLRDEVLEIIRCHEIVSDRDINNS